MMLTAARIALGLGMLATAAFGATATTPFTALHFPYEPGVPRLTAPGYGDQFRGAAVTASAYDDEQRPGFVNDGITNDTVMFWTSKVLPSWVRLDLPEPREIAQVNLHFRSPGTRIYHFTVEGSADGQSWQMLHDQRTGSALFPAKGLALVLKSSVKIRSLKLTVTECSIPDEGPFVVEIAGFAQPTLPGIEGGVGDLDHQYDARNVPLSNAPQSWNGTAWRGERVHGQFVVWSSPERLGLRAIMSALRDPAGHELPASAVTTRFVRNILADGQLVGDVLDDTERIDLPAGSYRALWLTVATPREAVPGKYSGTLTVRADEAEPKVFPVTLEILPATLPAPEDWKFHLDIWQHPWSIARWHGVKPWSDAHFAVMRPYLTELARAGQKVITTTITARAWGRRDYDDYGSMVTHLKQSDGSWKFDYGVFDRYVEFAMSCGITRQINCYAMLTWSGRLEYTDAATGDQRWAMCEPGTAEYADYWGPFLQDFQRHLEAKAWLERTRLGVDEAPAAMMEAMMKVVTANAPRIKAALAGNQAPSHYTGLDLADFTIIMDHASDDLVRDIAKRRSQGKVTTFYICLDPKRPNTFVMSPPDEAVWVGYYAAVNGYDGIARWALTTWPENPLHETLYSAQPWRRDLPPGDEFLLYPGPRASVHWEMFREGFEELEKLRWLKEHNGGKLPARVAELLEGFRDPKKLGDDEAVRRQVIAMRGAVEAAAREAKEN
ncbi:MAG: coagulation factor 5/8 type domain protein [Verrucomicrobia bacterium]|nr:coagulation factor 5/8 type domain protein [Verrucomicrobiota bacterium]